MEFSIIASYAGYCITLITLFTLICKPLRQFCVDLLIKKQQTTKQEEALKEISNSVKVLTQEIQDLRQENEVIREALQCTIRDTITHIYYKCTDVNVNAIAALEKENVNFLYAAYRSLNGNSYVQSCVEQLNSLPVIK